MRQNIESDRMRINCSRLAARSVGVARRATATGLSIFHGISHLLTQFVDCPRTAARDRLITRGKNTADTKHAVQWIKRHERDRRRAIWIGDETAMTTHILGVD